MIDQIFIVKTDFNSLKEIYKNSRATYIRFKNYTSQQAQLFNHLYTIIYYSKFLTLLYFSLFSLLSMQTARAVNQMRLMTSSIIQKIDHLLAITIFEQELIYK